MYNILLSPREISHRGQKISNILKPLSRIPYGPAYNMKQGVGTIIIGTHDGAPSYSEYTSWRFATQSRGYYASYYEKWTSINEEDSQFCLERAYLTIYRNQEEFICLHCDPNEEDIDGQGKVVYKKCPHLHIKRAEEPIPKAHISIAVGYITEVLASASSLTDTLKYGIQMIKDEIMDRL